MEKLTTKNGYYLMKLGVTKTGDELYSYGSDNYLDNHIENNFEDCRWTKKKTIFLLKKDIRVCDRKILKYERKKMNVIVDVLKEQKEALNSFLEYMK